MIKKIFLSLLICTLLICTLSIKALASEDFSNASSWAINELKAASSDGFVTEKITADFSKEITREEFCEIAVILYDRLGGTQQLEKENFFTDTVNPAIIKAFNAGIVTGTSKTTFSPKSNLTRQELCVMIIRAMNKSGIVFGEDTSYVFQRSYRDEEDIANWAFTQVRILNSMKILNGTGDKIEPLRYLTREQAVILLERTFLRDFLVDKGVLTAYLGNSSEIVIPSSVINIGEDVFHNSKVIKKVTIPTSVKAIGYAAFRECEELKTVVFNQGLEIIGEAAFELCEKLEKIVLPEGLKTIEFMAFQDCESLKNVVIPSSVTKIDDQAFYSCESLSSVTIPASVIEIGSSAFEECEDLTIICELGSFAEKYADENGFKKKELN